MTPKTYQINPQAKPRMTQRDRWRQRPCVMRYRAFKDEVRRLGIKIPESKAHITFYIPMPKSWSREKKFIMLGKPHQAKKSNDIDNLAKSLFDSVFDDDSQIWDVRLTKLWSDVGMISVEEI